ncbi:DUF6879 family protein [Streptomyces sp. NBRC 14336]|uniref:DUF6879 family protein n=1 Tax=Streptomyces sp. NBRC 14336 TaxID=3030992 RepID=UPI0025528E2C|nr:DUF6879 family protein [Streptomyces sp. NBRC 14336]WBO77883.1 hypothetical protein SBE_001440 [Streptomyces sp. SBE_14.2]
MNGATTGDVSPPQQDERRSKLFRKTLVTVLVATGAFFLTDVLSPEAGQLWQWTMSVVLGCAVLIVQYLVDFGERLEAMEEAQRRRIRTMRDSLADHHREMRAAVDESFAKINAATELFSQVDRSVLRSDGVTRLARKYTQVGEHGSEIVKRFAQEEIASLAQLMESLSNGTADCPGENHEWLIDLTACTKKTLYATSTSVDRDFWSSGPGRRYMVAQGDAIRKRGVEIRRLFLVDSPEEITDSLRRLCERQRRYGIDARIVDQSQLDNEPVTSVNDFIIFDDELCYEIEPDVRATPTKTTLKMTPDHVSERIERFAYLWEASSPTDPSEV